MGPLSQMLFPVSAVHNPSPKNHLLSTSFIHPGRCAMGDRGEDQANQWRSVNSSHILTACLSLNSADLQASIWATPLLSLVTLDYKGLFWWPTMLCDVRELVSTCVLTSPGLLQSLPIPSHPSSHLDFVTRLPESDGNTNILTVVDRF